MSTRKLKTSIVAAATSDGAGVKIKRVVGAGGMHALDPFLMLDEIRSDDADDYIAGFPAHPHRGFETLTYLLQGRMRHEDHMGNTGEIVSGGAQWMSAGRGVIHSEMPQQTEGLLHGFQLWINLPARLKMKDPDYRDIDDGEIPEVAADGGARVRVIAGRYRHAGTTVAGASQAVSAQADVLDVTLPPTARFEADIVSARTVLVYVYRGAIGVGGDVVREGTLAVLGDGDAVSLQAADSAAGCLLLSGEPIGEPVVQYGPFVMNTREEIEQAIDDYRNGTLAR